MLRPFPFALGIGTDICHVGRIYRIITKPESRAQQFIRNVLNPTEIKEDASKLKFAVELDTMKAMGKHPSELRRSEVAAKAWRLAQFLGGRWAAKEAAIKAHTWRRLSKHDITIIGGVQEDGRTTAPTMTIRSKNRREELVAKISISHDEQYATAVCLAAEEAEGQDADSSLDNEDGPAVEADASLLGNSTPPQGANKPLTFTELLLGKR